MIPANADRSELRQLFFSTWKKYQEKKILEPLEKQLVAIMIEHPEYHNFLNDPDKYLDKDFSILVGEVNPFLHMSLHLSIRDQITTDCPKGVNAIFQDYLKKYNGNHLDAEHHMMDYLAEAIWQTQKYQRFDEEKYVEDLRKGCGVKS